ncbi:Uncharacterized protein T05_10207 [Trichinella murrelli]|uniref:THAP4-like heme-binding domain-containing protein n=1 Tax=Trichinella murrelli TaxID=144512 RepID=A0A0V0TIA6_9BILA|nr:Uncharacterized protein T05_10207 [Trichinella murrelli]
MPTKPNSEPVLLRLSLSMAHAYHFFLGCIFYFGSLSSIAFAGVNPKYDVKKLPVDLVPVANLLGKWRSVDVTGKGIEVLPTGMILDFGIEPLPEFGARSLNFTGSTYWPDGSLGHFEWGFLMVKNRTRTNPQTLVGFITTNSAGYSLVEFGMVQNGYVDLELNNFVKVSFGSKLEVYELRRNLYMLNNGYLKQDVEAETNRGRAAYSVMYQKLYP